MSILSVDIVLIRSNSVSLHLFLNIHFSLLPQLWCTHRCIQFSSLDQFRPNSCQTNSFKLADCFFSQCFEQIKFGFISVAFMEINILLICTNKPAIQSFQTFQGLGSVAIKKQTNKQTIQGWLFPLFHIQVYSRKA